MANKPNNGDTQGYAPKGSVGPDGKPNGGQYLPKDGGEAYKAETDITDDAIDALIMASEFADVFSAASDEQKNAYRQMIRDAVSDTKTETQMKERFDDVTKDEFVDWSRQNEAAIREKYPNEAQGILDWFYKKYCGTPRSFDLNKALRMGYGPALDWFKWAMSSSDPALDRYHMKVKAFPSKEEIEEFASAFDKLTTSFEAPRDMKVFRYVHDDVVASWFKDLFEQNGIKVQKGIWGYDISNSKDKSIDEIVSILQDGIGMKVDGDKGFASFSTVESMSHMVHGTGEDFRRIRMEYDLPKGQKCFISHHMSESEGVLPRGLKFYIKDVYKQKDDYGERAVIRIGIIQ